MPDGKTDCFSKLDAYENIELHEKFSSLNCALDEMFENFIDIKNKFRVEFENKNYKIFNSTFLTVYFEDIAKLFEQ